MTKINFEENFEIYLFTYPNKSTGSSKLGEFLSFLKFNKVQLPFKFSFVSKEAALIPEISLNQNILIDFNAASLTGSKDEQFQEFLKSPQNRALERLYSTIELPHEHPTQSSAQMRKVCSLIKSLLIEDQFIFLEEPEVDLSPETLTLFVSALKERLAGSEINVFVYSENLPFWMPHANKIVKRRQDYSFHVSPVSHNYQWTEERDRFYGSSEKLVLNEGLKFYLPQKVSKKKSVA